MKQKFLSYLFLLGIIIFSCAKDIVDLTGSVRGSVKDYNSGQLIPNCQVSLNPSGRSTTTSEMGTYEFNGLEPGDYTISFNKSGYEQQSDAIVIISGQVTEKAALLKAMSSFSLSESKADFGDLQTSKSINLFNNSDTQCSFEISNIPQWLTVNPITGVISGGGTEVLQLSIDRNKVDNGRYSQSITVKYSGKASGTASLLVLFTKQEFTTPSVSCSGTASNITTSSFDISGTIEATGGQAITSYGHCWSTSANPTTSNEKTNLGAKETTGEFVSTVTGLAANTTYYVRAYAINANGTSYSTQISVLTIQSGGTPGTNITVTTGSASDLGDKEVTLNGQIEPGTQTIIEYGFYYGTSSSSQTLRSVAGTNNHSGTFSSKVEGLSPNNTYYYKAYARTQSDVVYGVVKSFKTGDTPGVSFSNYKYEITVTAYNKNSPQGYELVNHDYYTKFDTKGESIIEAGFVVGTDYYTSKPTIDNAKRVYMCEVSNNSIHYQYENKYTGVEREGSYYEYVRPYVIVPSGTYYGVRGYLTTSSGTFYYPDE